MSSIHSNRAKRWGTNAFVAEWFANAVEYCKTLEGQRTFQQWLLNRYGPEEARIKLREISQPARKKYGTPKGNAALWNLSGVELGVSDEAMKLYHMFTAENNMCSPPRTKPAPKQRRGESAILWLARRHEALLEGCKLPNINWEVARAIALSEYDRAKDTMEAWRTDPGILFETIAERQASTIPSPEILDRDPQYIWFHTLDDAFRSRMYGLTLSLNVWSQAAELFEDLARRGLTTASAIERAYKKDSQLLWRLVACLGNVRYLSGHFWVRLSQEMSWSEYFRPYFKRYRTALGRGIIEPNKAYIRKYGYKDSLVDELVVKYCTGANEMIVSFFDDIMKQLNQDPSEAKKFSAQAFAEMGDFATIIEFQMQIEQSPFGRDLIEYTKSVEHNRFKDPHFYSEISTMDYQKICPMAKEVNDWCDTHATLRGIEDTWLEVTSKLTLWDFFPSLFRGDQGPDPLGYDKMWDKVDRQLWASAKALDKPSTPGAVAKRFGLINPDDPEKPSFCLDFLFKCMDPAYGTKSVAATTPAPAQNLEQHNIPVAGPHDSAIKSGHAYRTELETAKSKEKVKTRRAGESQEVDGTTQEAEHETEPEANFPDVLPTEYKLGKKIMKIFHRILELDPIGGGNGPQKGQVRWGDFERAMKRVGFTISQTAGSSVRFDPPAKTARPITFHRPHPDSILTPHLIKWVGARLQRCYGWTTATFQQGSDTE